MAKRTERRANTLALDAILEYTVEPTPSLVEIGSESAGKIKVPSYGTLTVGEFRDIRKAMKQHNVKDATDDDAALDTNVDLVTDIALVGFRHRVNKNITRQHVEGMNMVLVKSMAALLMSDAREGRSGEDEGKAPTT